MKIKIMLVPGKIATVEVANNASVLDACVEANRVSPLPSGDWAVLATDREIRVQNRKFANTVDVPAGDGSFFGSIHSTPLTEGQVVLILTKIKGNAGEGVLTCTIEGVEYALETPDEIGNVLRDVAKINPDDISVIRINGETSHPTQLVGMGDVISVEYYSTENYDEDEGVEETFSFPDAADEPEEEITVVINGHTVTGRPQDIRRLLS